MAKKCFVIHEEVIDIFHDKMYIPTIEKLSFHIAHVRIIGSMEYGNTINYFSHDKALKKYKFKERLCKKNHRNDQYRNTQSTLG